MARHSESGQTLNIVTKMKKICIVGSGLIGSLLAIFLAQAGFEVDVYEKRSDPRKDIKTRGRSIALSLSDRGWRALREVGLEAALRPGTNPAYGRIVHQKDGVTYSQDYGDGSQAIWTVNRNHLNTALLKKAAVERGVRFFFEHSCEILDENTGEIAFVNYGTNEKTQKRYDHIIGVDGVFSTVRETLLKKNIWSFESSMLDFGYKELCIPPDAQGGYAMADHHVHVWPRKNSMFISFPANDGYFISNLFLPLVGEDSLESLSTPEALMSFFNREYKEVIPITPNFQEEFWRNPVSTITQVKGGPWHYKDKVLLMGDAAHAITPFYGMGMNIGFEDCTVLMELLRENNYDFGRAFESMSKFRKPNADAMSELSYKNFASIKESPDLAYHDKWLLERRIWKLFPQSWAPTYVLVAFSHVPLRDVPAIKERQDRIVNDLIKANPNILSLPDEQLRSLLLRRAKIDWKVSVAA